MRLKREFLLAPNHEKKGGLYHCVSRVVWREFIFGADEKEFFRSIMRKFERYCGVEIQAYCLMSNHFHILVKVPPRPDQVMSDEEFLERLALIYSKFQVADVRHQIETIRGSDSEGDVEPLVDALKTKYTRRMWDLSEFMKAIKQKFTLWYNKRNGKRGTLWEGRFKSVLVQGGFAAKMTAAYIDLNPVRAGMVEDAKDYRWCSYGEAVAGGKLAQQGLVRVMETVDKGSREEVIEGADWKSLMGAYRMLLAEEGEAYEQDTPLEVGESGEKRKKRAKGYSREEVEKILESGGKLGWAAVLRCRTRYFTDGVVIGGKEFVDTFFVRLKRETSCHEKRVSGARKIKVKGKELHTLRDLKKDVIDIPRMI